MNKKKENAIVDTLSDTLRGIKSAVGKPSLVVVTANGKKTCFLNFLEEIEVTNQGTSKLFSIMCRVSNEEYRICIGEYKEEERAKEVMLLLNEHICNGGTGFFKMPQDED